jgi:hypothetical protein
VNFQVTVLKILVAYPDGFALMADLKRDMAILATSGRDWADRTKRLAARVPDLDIFFARPRRDRKRRLEDHRQGARRAGIHGDPPRRRAADGDGAGREGGCAGATAAATRRAGEAATRTSRAAT